MKKLVFVLISLVATTCWAQEHHSVKFQLTENGVFIAPDSKEYIVMEYPGESQSDLYNKFLVAITGTYVSPKDVISKVENQMISVNGYKENALVISYNFFNLKAYYDILYVLKFQFKDGKVRIDVPVITKMCYMNSNKGTVEQDLSSFFRFEELKLTGKEKKDARRKKWVEGQNANKQEYMNMMSSTMNDLVNNIITKTNKNQSEDW